jgi:trk system potassium uptake protein TrkA
LLFAGINLAINPDHETVCAMRAVLFQTAATDVYEFADGRVRIVGARVEADAMVAGKTLADIVSELGTSMALVTAIVRGETTLIPRGDTVIMPDDQIYLAGERNLVDRSLRYVHVQTHPLEKVMIVGANKIGLELARDLLITGIKVKIIDRSEEKCQRAAEQLRHALVLHGDGTDVELLQSEGVDEMDGFVSLVRDEETNIMACLLARYHGAGKTVCLVNRPDYVPLLPLLGVDAAVSPRLSTAARIARFVKRGAVVSAENLGYSGAEILQIRLEKGSLGLNKPLAELDFPRDAVIGAVLKRGHVVTPRGDTVLEAGDEVVVFALPSGVPAVENFFTAE